MPLTLFCYVVLNERKLLTQIHVAEEWRCVPKCECIYVLLFDVLFITFLASGIQGQWSIPLNTTPSLPSFVRSEGKLVVGKETQKYKLSRAVWIYVSWRNIVIGNYTRKRRDFKWISQSHSDPSSKETMVCDEVSNVHDVHISNPANPLGINKYMFTYNSKSDWNNSVGITTRYELDGPRIESQWRRDFRCPSRQTPRPTQPPVRWVPYLSRG